MNLNWRYDPQPQLANFYGPPWLGLKSTLNEREASLLISDMAWHICSRICTIHRFAADYMQYTKPPPPPNAWNAPHKKPIEMVHNTCSAFSRLLLSEWTVVMRWDGGGGEVIENLTFAKMSITKYRLFLPANRRLRQMVNWTSPVLG
jgi:hypothetical protein